MSLCLDYHVAKVSNVSLARHIRAFAPRNDNNNKKGNYL